MSRGLASVAALVWLGVSATVAAQAPQAPPPGGPQGGPPGGRPPMNFPTPKNLQVLPKEMDGRAVAGVMRGFTQALGVRCVYCHVPGANEQDLGTYDFASDEKANKKEARSMLKFTMALNRDFPTDVGDPPAEGERRVTCWTCHRGEKEPQTRRPEQPGGPGAPGAPGGPGGALPPGQPGPPPRPPAI
ncbi:c-type cytochrome [Luteitalea sp. TBR-22]|uniref:c-type cytochrome n=1 Tax=Luteitalea sp. TBR-22 TaxID=2802971 RepID=UPI001AF143AD|nr:c-type cytochrome [Luteitalea sp. TBR-22]